MVPKRRAFTLIELLVVIAVIALLLSVITPALRKAKDFAKAMVCSSNIRQMSLGFILYAEDNNGKTMRFVHTPGRYWIHEIAPYLGDDYLQTDTVSGKKSVMKVALCPKTRPRTDLSGGYQPGTRTEPWGWMNTSGSYGLNLWLLLPSPNGNDGYVGGSFGDDVLKRDNFFTFLADASGGNTPIMGDSIWVGSWPYSDDLPPTDLETGGTTHARGYFMQRFCIDRHGKGIRVGYVDGHVKEVDLEDLWLLTWHKRYAPNGSVVIKYRNK